MTQPPGTARPRTAPGAWPAWGIGILAYSVAVFQRSSLGVSGLLAQHRFHASASVLSLFAVLQLAVYAGMQVPVGVLLDRFGTRRMVLTGALVMAAGQLLLAVATAVPVAVLARVLVGGGDAMTFISVLRLVPLWFGARRVPLVTQLTGITGQVGQVVAAYPLVALLHHAGWTPSFAGAAAVGALVALLVAAALRDHPPDAPPLPPPAGVTEVRRRLREAWREPGTRIGLWTHFVTQFPGTAFALLWGYPFLVAGEGRSPAEAGLLLTLMVVVAMGVGPVLGALAGGWPYRRSALVFSVVGATAVLWTVVLAWPGRAPLWLLVVLALVLATNGPGSMVGFDYARTYNPPLRLGSATGIVNVGGFVAALSTILLVGVVLDLRSVGGPTSYTLADFRVAFTVQYVGWAVGLVGFLRTRRLMRRQLAERGVRLDPLPAAVSRRVRQARRQRGRPR